MKKVEGIEARIAAAARKVIFAWIRFEMISRFLNENFFRTKWIVQKFCPNMALRTLGVLCKGTLFKDYYHLGFPCFSSVLSGWGVFGEAFMDST